MYMLLKKCNNLGYYSKLLWKQLMSSRGEKRGQ